MDEHLRIRLSHLETDVRNNLSVLDEVKVGVSDNEREDSKQYFTDKGFNVTTGAELLPPPFVKVSYYLLIKEKK